MIQFIIPLPTISMTSSSVDTSTQTLTAVDISDAITISGYIREATTAPGIQLQVAFTSESTATFVAMKYPSSGATLIYFTSEATVVPAIGAKQARIGTSNVTSTSATLVWAKRIQV